MSSLIVAGVVVVMATAIIVLIVQLRQSQETTDAAVSKNRDLLKQQDAILAKVKEHGAPVSEFRPPKMLNQSPVAYRRARLATMDHLFTDKEMARARKRFDNAVKKGWIEVEYTVSIPSCWEVTGVSFPNATITTSTGGAVSWSTN